MQIIYLSYLSMLSECSVSGSFKHFYDLVRSYTIFTSSIVIIKVLQKQK